MYIYRVPCWGNCASWYYNEDFAPGSNRFANMGMQFAEGWRAVFVANKGDRKQRQEMNVFDRSYRQTFICERDFACKLTKKCPCKAWTYADFSRTAKWRKSQVQHDDYMRIATAAPIWTCVAGYRLQGCMHDAYLYACMGCFGVACGVCVRACAFLAAYTFILLIPLCM